MNYQALKFIECAMENILKGGERRHGKEFISAVQEMLAATKKLMKFF